MNSQQQGGPSSRTGYGNTPPPTGNSIGQSQRYNQWIRKASQDALQEELGRLNTMASALAAKIRILGHKSGHRYSDVRKVQGEEILLQRDNTIDEYKDVNSKIPRIQQALNARASGEPMDLS